MSQAHLTSSILSRLLEPVGRMMPVSFARELAALRATPDIQARIDELAGKCNEGRLTAEERIEYDAYIDAIDVIRILQAQARAVLGEPPDASTGVATTEREAAL